MRLATLALAALLLGAYLPRRAVSSGVGGRCVLLQLGGSAHPRAICNRPAGLASVPSACLPGYCQAVQSTQPSTCLPQMQDAVTSDGGYLGEIFAVAFSFCPTGAASLLFHKLQRGFDVTHVHSTSYRQPISSVCALL